jgi:hypothetical protein
LAVEGKTTLHSFDFQQNSKSPITCFADNRSLFRTRDRYLETSMHPHITHPTHPTHPLIISSSTHSLLILYSSVIQPLLVLYSSTVHLVCILDVSSLKGSPPCPRTSAICSYLYSSNIHPLLILCSSSIHLLFILYSSSIHPVCILYSSSTYPETFIKQTVWP